MLPASVEMGVFLSLHINRVKEEPDFSSTESIAHYSWVGVYFPVDEAESW